MIHGMIDPRRPGLANAGYGIPTVSAMIWMLEEKRGQRDERCCHTHGDLKRSHTPAVSEALLKHWLLAMRHRMRAALRKVLHSSHPIEAALEASAPEMGMA